MQYRHHLELTWLEDCLALKETLNFSKASASRYVTQPAFSRRIQSLEEWVGTPLFERSKRGVTLTKAGEVFTDQLPELIHSLYTLKSGFDTLIPFSKPDSETLKPLWNINNKIQFPYLSFSSQSGLGRIIANTASINRITHNINVAFVADLAATLLAMVRSGDGVAWIPQSLARQDIEAKTIVTAAEKESNLWVPIEIRLYRPAKRMPPDAEELWEIFVEEQI